MKFNKMDKIDKQHNFISDYVIGSQDCLQWGNISSPEIPMK